MEMAERVDTYTNMRSTTTLILLTFSAQKTSVASDNLTVWELGWKLIHLQGRHDRYGNMKKGTIPINPNLKKSNLLILLHYSVDTDLCGVMTEDLDVAKAPPIMRHIIRGLLELPGLILRSQQASAAQGYNVLCSKWASPL